MTSVPREDIVDPDDGSTLFSGQDVWVLPSSLGTDSRFDADAQGVVLNPVEPENQMVPGAFNCDLDGDGYDDILFWEGGDYPSEGVRRNWVRVAYGSPNLVQDRAFTRVLGLSWLGEGLNGVECGADIDGDGRDDATVRTEQDGTFWLDLAAAVDGEPLENYARRRWSEPVRPIGDVDGDGYGDLQIFCCAWSYEQIFGSDELLVDLLVPGGPTFGGTDTERRSITAEYTPGGFGPTAPQSRTGADRCGGQTHPCHSLRAARCAR